MPVIKQKTQFINSAIGVSSFDTGADAVYQAVSNFSDTVGRIAIEEGSKAAERRGVEGAQSLTPEEVVQRSKQSAGQKGIQKIEDEAFNQVLNRRFVDTVSKDIQIESKKIAQKYRDPVSYERMFGNYLRDLTEGADERFQGVVTNISKYEMADTKLRLTAAARARARSAAASGINNVNKESREAAFDSARTGNFEAALAIIQERSTATQEGESAGLMKEGSSKSVENSLATAAISGMMGKMLQEVEDPAEQAALSVYFMTQGASQGALIDPDRKAQIDQFMPYVNLQTSGKIIQSMDSMNSDLNRIREVERQRAKAEADRQARIAIVDFGSDLESLDISFSNAAIQAVSTPDLSVARGQVDSIVDQFNSMSLETEQLFVAGRIKPEERKQRDEALRKTALRPLALAAASEGNVPAIKAYLTSGSTEQLMSLSASQRAIVQTLRESKIYTDADRSYLEGFLADSQNKVQIEIDKEVRNARLNSQISNLNKNLTSGLLNQDEIAAAGAQLANALKNGDIENTRFTTLSESIGASTAKGIINIATQTASSEDMLALTNYIRSNGQEDSGLSGIMREVGDAVLAATPESKRDAVTTHANTLRDKIEKKESDAQSAFDKQELIRTVATGAGSVLNKTHRKAADEILERAGINILDPSSKNDKVYALMRPTPPQSLIDGLNNIALGLNAQGADVLLDHFALLSNDADPSGVFVNRFGVGDGAALSSAKVAMLQDIVNIRKITGRPAEEIAQTLIERRSDPKSDRSVKAAFEGKSPKQYVEQTYGPIIAEDLGDAAEYYARIGLSKDEIDDNIESLVDTRFLKGDVVIDPRFPMGSGNRTMYSLQAKFPNEARRDAFIDVVVSQLPEGFELHRGRESNRARTRRYSEAGITTPPKQTYLVAHEGTAGAAYYAYFVDDANELRPLIQEINNELTWPMFDESDLADYDKLREIELAAEAEEDLDAAERTLEVTRQRPGLRSLSDVSKLTLK
jgi:hypothetical protein